MVRSRFSSRSYSARVAGVQLHPPARRAGVDVFGERLTNLHGFQLGHELEWERLRPKRESCHTTVSPGRSAFSICSSSGRLALAPLICSSYIRVQPAAISASAVGPGSGPAYWSAHTRCASHPSVCLGWTCLCCYACSSSLSGLRVPVCEHLMITLKSLRESLQFVPKKRLAQSGLNQRRWKHCQAHNQVRPDN
jgi:hypothetical protein